MALHPETKLHTGNECAHGAARFCVTSQPYFKAEEHKYTDTGLEAMEARHGGAHLLIPAREQDKGVLRQEDGGEFKPAWAM